MNAIERIHSLKDTECIVDVLLKEVSTHECNNCGKCVFGYEGVTQLEMILKDITEKKGKSTDIELMRELCGLMKSQSLCEKDEDIIEAVLYAIENYKEDFNNHIAKKSCRAGVCSKFVTYHIIASKCTGCTDCIDECEEDAIAGKSKFIHVINQNECTQCGVCLSVCEENAIVKAGAVKPKCPPRPIPCRQ